MQALSGYLQKSAMSVRDCRVSSTQQDSFAEVIGLMIGLGERQWANVLSARSLIRASPVPERHQI